MPEDNYNKKVKIGNWFEESLCEEEDLKDFSLLRSKSSYLMQKTADLKLRTLERRKTTVLTDGYVHFGDKIMILCQKDATQREGRNTMTRPDLALSINYKDPVKMLLDSKICGPCDVTASPYVKPIMRNMFLITSFDGSKDGEPVRYGQQVMIRTPSDAGGLYLQSDRKDMMTFARQSAHHEVCLVTEPSFLAHWEIHAHEPRLRNEFLGAPVKANEMVIIINNKTNQNLNVEEAFHVHGAYGREYEISCHRVKDSHRYELGTNLWVLRMMSELEDSELKY